MHKPSAFHIVLVATPLGSSLLTAPQPPIKSPEDGADGRVNVRFVEGEAADIGHVWPLWRQNLTDVAQKAFQPKAK